ncbi:hypothetical protein LCGC14_1134470 [marine sediment metagenome]|uniref:Uncharacterized protein n=1 Tax=marine sediment metagenome TaxID=412755 RepID=A0A0F9M077_9ZZZZ
MVKSLARRRSTTEPLPPLWAYCSLERLRRGGFAGILSHHLVYVGH